jgi:flavodoxin
VLKILVVYYSYEGNTRFVAEHIAEFFHADVQELKPKIDMHSRSFMKYVWGGKMVLMREKPDLEPLRFNPGDYEVIFIGTPVWAWTFTPALNSFLAGNPLQGKRIVLFYCHGGGPRGMSEKFKARLPGNTIIGERGFQDPLNWRKEEAVLAVRIWCRELKSILGIE